jgi:DNA-binding transcriptional regulator LsrR (DeoR family)
MTAVISLKNLTDKQRKVWRMRYRKGWRMRRIALEMGMSDSGVSKMLQRAHARAGLTVCRVSVIRGKPRNVRLYLLSEVFEQV